MKKITLLGVAAVALSFAACKKDRVCTCTDSGGGSETRTYTKSTKATAQANCLHTKYTVGSVTVEENCTLK